mgnify:CR=1 FL=1
MKEAPQPLWKQLPLPSDEERYFREWQKREEERRQREEEERGSDERVIIIDL